jgi:hypothetical protein
VSGSFVRRRLGLRGLVASGEGDQRARTGGSARHADAEQNEVDEDGPAERDRRAAQQEVATARGVHEYG